uniref:NAD-dependent epimerase/dehydratase domain-containing protein n=1 Tax=viral metagenome TaxID=1070528 RepID=A0A6C0I7N3_9ZZZZ
MSHDNSEPVVLVFGGNGWIGSKVVQLLRDTNITVIKSLCRADDIKMIQKEINMIKNVTHIMSFIGRTHGVYDNEVIGTIDYLEKPGKLLENINDNLFSPIGLAELSKKNGIHFTYLGTGCIFEYDEQNHFYGNVETGFLEADLPNFFGSSYSIVKGYTDRLMQLLYSDSTLNARIRMPITDEQGSPRNFITKITSYKKVCSMPNSMTVLDELLPVLIEMAFKKQVGTVNLTNPGVISHNEILEMYREIVDPEFTWTNFSIEEQNQILASKRSNNCLDTMKLSNISLGLRNNVSPIKDAVRDVLKRMSMK